MALIPWDFGFGDHGEANRFEKKEEGGTWPVGGRGVRGVELEVGQRLLHLNHP